MAALAERRIIPHDELKARAEEKSEAQAQANEQAGAEVRPEHLRLLEALLFAAAVPLDEKTLVDSVKKTSRCIVIDEGYFRYGITGELASVIQEQAFFDLDGPVRRLGAMHVPIPFSPSLEDVTVPSERQVFDLARQMVNR